ncbi:MAG: levansucrase [Pseudomonadota bacterium]
MLALDDKWIWDFWLARNGRDWHAYFLQADKSLKDPELRHWNVSYGHAVSQDLRTWRQLGTCFQPAPIPAWDDKSTWTGSVVQDDDGLWHLFYTGSSRAEHGLKQRIGHATSTDMHNWQRVGDGLILDIDERWYEEHKPGHWHDRAMRDPWVMRDPEGDGWVMYFTGRAPDIAEPNAGGAIGFARSKNLTEWRLEPPIFVGGFGQLEVPQVFPYQGKWYCIFSVGAEHWSRASIAGSPVRPHTGTHYLIADRPSGPWQIAPLPFLDGAEPPYRYSGKVLMLEDGPALMAFEHTASNGSFIGRVCDPLPLRATSDGLLVLETQNGRRAISA